jgi:hypothetical protein
MDKTSCPGCSTASSHCCSKRLEPLRRDNPDFDLVGPGWLSVATFAALVVFHALLVAALAGRLSRAVPLLAALPGAIAAHAPCCCCCC